MLAAKAASYGYLCRSVANSFDGRMEIACANFCSRVAKTLRNGVNMYLSENEIARFLGTGERNAAGEDLETFLKKYNPNRYQNPSNTVDMLIFTYSEIDGIKNIKKVLLIKRGNHPSIGWWALPGGFVEYSENIDVAAARELYEETGIKDVELCQLKCYGDYDRDPRTRIITTAYVALVPEGRLSAKAGDDAREAGWFDIQTELLDERCCEGYKVSSRRLVLTSSENGVTTSTDVTVKERINGILPQTAYKVTDTRLLAADHGAIILEGYDFVKKFCG